MEAGGGHGQSVIIATETPPVNVPNQESGRISEKQVSATSGGSAGSEYTFMVFGHNTNLKLGNVTFHIQTEDRGQSHALIDTTVYYHGRVMHRRTNNYFDLLPLDEDREQALKLRLDEQHRRVIEEIRSGELQLSVPPVVEKSFLVGNPVSGEPLPLQAPSQQRKLVLELVNAASWLTGRHARLSVSVHENDGVPVHGAVVSVGIEGSEHGERYSGETGNDGQVEIQFEMPRIATAEAALVIQAEDHGVLGHLRFALRAKPRVPSV